MPRRLVDALILPMLRRPRRFQVAALCWRRTPGGVEILLVTSRDSGRWVLPKGWPMRGLSAPGTALEEAWEEAGVLPATDPPRRIGRYRYDKRLKDGLPVDTEVDVYAVPVADLADTFPETDRRTRRWMAPDEAARAVDEPSLKSLLKTLPPDLGG